MQFDNPNKRYEELKYNLITNGSPVKTGRKIDGKDEYVIRRNIGLLPNNTAKNYTLPIKINEIIPSKSLEIYGVSSTGELIPIPRYTGSSYINCYITSDTSTNVSTLVIVSNSDLSRFTGYFNMYFTYKN